MRKIAIAVVSLLTISTASEAKTMAGVIDLSGKVIIPFQYRSIRSVGNSLFLCEGYNSPPGAVLPKPSVVPLSGLQVKGNGVAQNAYKQVSSRNGTVLLDSSGKTVPVKLPAGVIICSIEIPNKYQDLEHPTRLPRDTRVLVAGKNGYGLVDGNGVTIMEPTYAAISSAGPLQLHVMKAGESYPHGVGTLFDLDLDFQRSLQKETPEGQAAFAPHEGMLRFSEKGLFGFKNSKGKVVIPAKYYAAREFSCGFAPVRLNSFAENGRYVYIDHLGKPVSKEYFRAQPFVGKTAIVATYESRSLVFGLLDSSFKYIQDPYCHGLVRLKNGMVVPVQGMINKVFDKNGKPIFDIAFNKILVNEGADGLVFRSEEPGKNKDVRNIVIEVYDESGKVIKKTSKEVESFGHKESYHHDFEFGKNGERLNSIVTFKGNRKVMGPTEDDLHITSDNLVIKTIHTKNFSKSDWEGPDSDRETAFVLFVKNSKLQDMTKSALEGILGKGKSEEANLISYDLSPNNTGAVLGVVRFKDEKIDSIDVRRGTESKNGMTPPNPHTTTVPVDVKSASGFKYDAYMEVDPKKGKGNTVHIQMGRKLWRSGGITNLYRRNGGEKN